MFVQTESRSERGYGDTKIILVVNIDLTARLKSLFFPRVDERRAMTRSRVTRTWRFCPAPTTDYGLIEVRAKIGQIRVNPRHALYSDPRFSALKTLAHLLR